MQRPADCIQYSSFEIGILAIHALWPRLLFVGVAWLFAELVRHVYVDLLASNQLLSYVDLRAMSVSIDVKVLFTSLAVVPSFFLPLHIARPTDIVQLFLYYAVHIPTCVLLPLVSHSPLQDQVLFSFAILLGLLMLNLRYFLPLISVPCVQVEQKVFWRMTLVLCAIVVSVLLIGREGSFSEIDWFNVYEQREGLADRAAEVGSMYFYLANWAGAAISPFLIIAGLHMHRWLIIIFGIVLALVSFVASFNKASYMFVPAVLSGYVLLRVLKGRHIAAALGAGLILLTGALLAIDYIVSFYAEFDVPVATWAVFHRTFTNNGYLSAIYLDLFRSLEPAFYADSFMRWFVTPQFDSPIAIMAGTTFTDVRNVHANASLWADGYANMKYAGIAFSALSLFVVSWVYDSLTVRKDVTAATAALIVPACIFANTPVHTATLSNGIFLLFLLIWLWNDGNRSDACQSDAGASL